MRDPRRRPPRQRTPKLPGVPRPHPYAAALVKHEEPPADAPADERPDVSSPAWVEWAERQARASRQAGSARSDRPAVEGTAERDGVLPVAPPRPADVGAAPRPADVGAAPTRRRALAVVGASTAALLLVTAAGLWLLTRDDPQHDAGREPGADSPAHVPAAPVQLAGNAAYTELTVQPDDVLAVRQWLHVSSGLRRLTLTAPGGRVRGESLRVYADGELVAEVDTVNARTRAVPVGGATSVYLEYRLSGALERTTPPPGRALARVTSLDLAYDAPPDTTTIAFRGAEVLALACTPIGSPEAPQPCGVDAGGGWEVQPPASQVGYHVMAQLDLEEPGKL